MHFTLKNMLNVKTFYSLLICFVLSVKKIDADSPKCVQKEKHLAILDLAKDSISKAKNLHPTCVNNDTDVSSNTSKCGAASKVSAHLEIAMNLIEEAKKNYTACDGTSDITDSKIIHQRPSDCLEILQNGDNKNGVYAIWPKLRSDPLKVYCDMDTDGGGWTMIQRRGPFSNKIDFYRMWNDYKFGFGNISEEFWIGNDNIFALTKQGNYSLRFDMQKPNKETRFSIYSSFWIEAEDAAYKIHFDAYTGTSGDGIRNINNAKFSTKDVRNDIYDRVCTDLKKGGWWYSNCGNSNPNGINLPGGENDAKYMNWHPFTAMDSLQMIEMKIRPEI